MLLRNVGVHLASDAALHPTRPDSMIFCSSSSSKSCDAASNGGYGLCEVVWLKSYVHLCEHETTACTKVVTHNQISYIGLRPASASVGYSEFRKYNSDKYPRLHVCRKCIIRYIDFTDTVTLVFCVWDTP
jgi:hypothetical protein